MALTQTDRRRYVRHTLLSEIGTAGQERLCGAHIAINIDADADAASVARDYLERAGVVVTQSSGVPITVASAAAVDTLAPLPLRHAAAALAGAFAAVETIKSLVGVGTSAALTGTLHANPEAS